MFFKVKPFRTWPMLLAAFAVSCNDAELQVDMTENQSAPDMESADALVADLTQYIKWSPGDTTVEFDVSSARAGGLSEERIVLGVQLIELSNEGLLSSAQKYVEGIEAAPKRLQEMGVSIGFPWISAVASATLQSFFVALGDVCPTPRFAPAISGWASRAVAISKLTSAGYRWTLYPSGACAIGGNTAYGQFGSDFTKPLYYSVYGSSLVPCYRYQGLVSESPPWTFRVQGAPSNGTVGIREPNPEICEYTWPTWWWGAYTAYFHMIRC